MEKCRQTRRHKCTFKISICSSQCNNSKKRQQFYRLKSFAQNTDVHISGKKRAKLHNWPKMEQQLLVQWTTSYLLSFQDCHHLPAAARLLHRDQRISPILPVNPKQHQIQWRPERAKRARGKPMQANPDMQDSGSRGLAHTEDETDKEDPTQGIPDWLQPFTANPEDLETHVSAHPCEREISDSEGDASYNGDTKKRKHGVSYSLSPTDRNCDMCSEKQNYEGSLQKTHWYSSGNQKRKHSVHAYFRKNQKRSIPRAEKFGNLITADHKVLNEGSESRNNHRYAVVLQDLGTYWIQTYPRKNKNS